MPDTHLAMPRSLSAELAQTPEALAAHAPMTTSDATNGTAAAAAAFARLLASGDQAMQSETENTASTAERKPLPLRDALLAGTAVTPPHPDAEILELARQRRAVIDAMDVGVEDDEVDRLEKEWLRLDRRIMDIEPKTGAGLAAQLAVVWRGLDPADGYEDGPAPKSREERQWLWKAKENAAKLDDDSATLDAFREFLLAQCGWVPAWSDEVSGAYSDHCDALAMEVMAKEPTTAAGFAAQFYTWLHLQHGAPSEDDLLADYSPSYKPEHAHFAHNQAERMIVERAFRMTEAIRGEERFRSYLRQMDGAALGRMLDATADATKLPAEPERQYSFPDWMMELVAEADAAIMAEIAASKTRNPDKWAEQDRQITDVWCRIPEERKEAEIRWLEFGVAEDRFHRMAMTFAGSIGRGDQYRRDLYRMADKGGDADLLDLGRLHEDAVRDADAVHAIARPEAEAERLNDRISSLKDRIFATEATTLAGLAVQLAALWDLQGPTLEEENGPLEDSDIGLKAVWNIWQTARKLSGQPADIRPIVRGDDDISPENRADLQAISAIYDQLDAVGKASVVAVARATIHIQQAVSIAQAIGAEFPEALAGVAKMMRADAALLEAAANDQRQDADAFADTVMAFEAEAPATLALPLEPTGRMIDAGAGAAGITPEQFQAAYAAAVEALKLERAA
ncbi:hypothetical protein [Azospirillum sp. B21]|uniref:hypothetical protein n=1 Tax=Azospirillum sp. B21 TaxID=2607496 RepID=UPI00165F56A1|nr:hypothetical protein [Azospirillum sp. B21]